MKRTKYLKKQASVWNEYKKDPDFRKVKEIKDIYWVWVDDDRDDDSENTSILFVNAVYLLSVNITLCLAYENRKSLENEKNVIFPFSGNLFFRKFIFPVFYIPPFCIVSVLSIKLMAFSYEYYNFVYFFPSWFRSFFAPPLKNWTSGENSVSWREWRKTWAIMKLLFQTFWYFYSTFPYFPFVSSTVLWWLQRILLYIVIVFYWFRVLMPCS